MPLRRRFRLAAIAFVVVAFTVIVLYAVFIYLQLSGIGGWEPNPGSVYAARGRAVNATLRNGMSRDEVKEIFRKDIALFRTDSTEDTSNAYWGKGVPTWPIESDLFIFEPRPHFWNAFDTEWTVRARFNSRGKLIEHNLHPSDCCGP